MSSMRGSTATDISHIVFCTPGPKRSYCRDSSISMAALRLTQVQPTRRLLSTLTFTALCLAINAFEQPRYLPNISDITCESNADCRALLDHRLNLSGICLDLGTKPTCMCDFGWYAVAATCKKYNVTTDVSCVDGRANMTCSQLGMLNDKCMVAADGAKKCQCEDGLTYKDGRCMTRHKLSKITTRDCNNSTMDCQWANDDETTNRSAIETGYWPLECANYHRGKYCQCAEGYARFPGTTSCLSGKELASNEAYSNDPGKTSRSSRMRVSAGILVASTFTVAKWLILTWPQSTEAS